MPESDPAPEEYDVSTHSTGYNYGELKERAQANGYKLRPYSKASSSSYYSMNFIFSTRLKRDTLFILYAFMLIEILIGYFLLDRFAGLGYVFYVVTACILLLLPISCGQGSIYSVLSYNCLLACRHDTYILSVSCRMRKQKRPRFSPSLSAALEMILRTLSEMVSASFLLAQAAILLTLDIP